MTLFDSKLSPSYAGFWIRFVALLIDGVILGVPLIVLDMVFHTSFVIQRSAQETSLQQSVIGFFVIAIVSWLYQALLESSAKQSTFGKRLVGIIVTDISGNRLTFSKATVRYLGQYLSGLIFYLGYIMAAFTPRKQTLHDYIAGTVVVHGSI